MNFFTGFKKKGNQDMADIYIKKQLIKEYEDILLKQRIKFSNSLFMKATPVQAKEHTILLLHYFIENIMGWTPEEAGQYLTEEMLKRFKLYEYLRYLDVPQGIVSEEHTYVLSLLYPNVFQYNDKAVTLKIFKRVLAKEIKLPKFFFTGMRGKERGIICLKSMIDNTMFLTSVEDLYVVFSSKSINKTLKKYCLHNCCKEHFTSPLQFLHYMLPPSQRDEFLYNFYSFKNKNADVLEEYYSKYASAKTK